MMKTGREPVRVTLFVLLALLATSCSDRRANHVDNTKNERGLPKAVDKVLPKGYGTQDFLIHLDLQVLDKDKKGRSIYRQVLKRAEDGAGQAKALSDLLQFRPTNSIKGKVREDSGELLPSISVDFGLLSIVPGQAARLLDQVREKLPPGAKLETHDLEQASLLVEFSTADLNKAPMNVQPGDVSQVDLTFVDEIKVGDRLRSIYVWGQTLPPPNPSAEANFTPHEVFESRWNANRFQILGSTKDGPAPLVDEEAQVVEGSKTWVQRLKPLVYPVMGIGAGVGVVLAAPEAFFAAFGAWGLGVLGVGGGVGTLFTTLVLMPLPNAPEVICREEPYTVNLKDLFSGSRSSPVVKCSRGTGDIHMETFDGQRYDLQAAGEFVVAEDRAGKVRIQLRLEPPRGSRKVTLATAVAAKVDGVGIAIHLYPPQPGGVPDPRLYVNGRPAELERGGGMRLGKDGGITFTGTAWVIAWPDGTVAWVARGALSFDLIVRPGSSAGELVGLWGNADGKLDGDLVTRDGFVLPAEVSFKELYGRFAESWRISQKESLFHYAQGESTETFTDRGVPSDEVNVRTLDPDARAQAERLCRAAGITGSVALDECILDVAVTGDSRFAFSAALAQSVTHGRAASPSTPANGGKQTGTLTVNGTGKETYFVYDSAGQGPIVFDRATNAATELLPGTYLVKVGNRSLTVQVRAGQTTKVGP